MENLLLAHSFAEHGASKLSNPELQHRINANIEGFGWTLLRGFDVNLESFGSLLTKHCQALSFDPARAFVDGKSQKVDAGKQAVGLHIENGNTPFPPKLVAFYSAKSAAIGSETTLCDGADLFNALPDSLKKIWQNKVTVSRYLPSPLWRKYVTDHHLGVNQLNEVTKQHLSDLIAINPNQRGIIDAEDGLDYELDICPCLPTKSGADLMSMAFANALLGPSFNYQKPTYRFAGGELVTDELLEETASYAEQCTHEITWEDGDIVLINNHRVMHGRREILGSLDDRKLFIGMGS